MTILLNILTVEPSNQRRLLQMLRGNTATVIGTLDGWISTTLIASADGRCVLIHPQWLNAAGVAAMRCDPRMVAYFPKTRRSRFVQIDHWRGRSRDRGLIASLGKEQRARFKNRVRCWRSVDANARSGKPIGQSGQSALRGGGRSKADIRAEAGSQAIDPSQTAVAADGFRPRRPPFSSLSCRRTLRSRWPCLLCRQADLTPLPH